MRGAIAEFREIAEAGGVPQLRFLARAWNVPKSTLQPRVTALLQPCLFSLLLFDLPLTAIIGCISKQTHLKKKHLLCELS